MLHELPVTYQANSDHYVSTNILVIFYQSANLLKYFPLFLFLFSSREGECVCEVFRSYTPACT